ncbi:5-carboxymethyl-2-hydroxymuconate isomerase [Algirhabdus cladophorae]|uniref:5-carboxymethyl-2-hydroxymuconate isomerase n=1 Tax=Algirhabdus cladophorae TaxID=3377108 RepID=UPI003B849FF7
MPHFQIDYSANLEDAVDISALCEAVRAQAVEIEAFPLAGVRVRATRVDHYAMADGQPKHGFIDLSIRLREGRTSDVKIAALQQVFGALKTFMAPVLATHSVALSAEMRDISPEFSLKFGTVRAYLGDG